MPASVPAWLVTDAYEDVDRGALKTGKEADVWLVERRGADGRSCLLAHKRYRPLIVTKGELEERGFTRARAFVHDARYREGRTFVETRVQRAVDKRTKYGRTDEGVLMEFIGDDTGAAPQLARARLGRDELEEAWSQLVTNLHRFVAAGLVHADLSAYNLLWRDGRIVVIDLPQAVDIDRHPTALDLLHRDVQNVATFFSRKGIMCNGDALFAGLAAAAFR